MYSFLSNYKKILFVYGIKIPGEHKKDTKIKIITKLLEYDK